jgi:glycosyltransferase involved in cell wall biosynthesis
MTGTAPALRIGYVLGTTSGGTGRHVAMLAKALVQAGAEVRVFAPAPTRPLFAATPAPAFDPVAIADRPRPARDVLAILCLRRLLARLAPDVVHAHGLRAGALSAVALWVGPAMTRRRARGRPALVVTVHNAPPAAGRLAMIYAGLERIVARRADVVLCVSSDLSARMAGLGARSVGRAVVPAPGWTTPGADPAELDSHGRPVVLGIGRLAPQKRFDVLLRAAATTGWRERRPAPLVVIAGAGPLAAELAGLGDELGVDARFLGQRDDVARLLAAADVVVLPSQWEGQPLILQEALRAARPIVAADVGGVRDLTGDRAALLVPPGDPQALSLAVLAVLDDPGLAARLAVAAAARAAGLPAPGDAISSVISLYDRLTARCSAQDLAPVKKDGGWREDRGQRDRPDHHG